MAKKAQKNSRGAKSTKSIWILRRSNKLRRSLWLRLGATSVVGLSVLFALEPFGFGAAGLAGGAGLFILSWSLSGRALWLGLFWGCLCALCVSTAAFQWLLPTITVYGHLSYATALPLFLLHGIVFQLKLPAILVGVELLRRNVSIGALWSLPLLGATTDLWLPQLFPYYWGNLTGPGPLLNQPAAAVGVTGLGFLLLLFTGLLLTTLRLISRVLRHRQSQATKVRAIGSWRDSRTSLLGLLRLRTRAGLGAASLILAAAVAYSAVRLSDIPALLDGKPVRVTIIQPNTGRGLARFKEDQEFAAEAVNRVFNLALSGVVRAQGTSDLIILPESAIPFHGTRDTAENRNIYSPTFHSVVAFLARYGRTDVLYNEIERRDGRLYNAAVVFSRSGQHGKSYYKQKLLPFGEYLPGESFLPLRRLLPEASRYEAADRARLVSYGIEETRRAQRLALPSPELLGLFGRPQEIVRDWPHGQAPEQGTLAPLICYEGLFPDLVRDFVRGDGARASGPDFLVNISNDAWFGDYLENYQHAGAARMRAIETGRYFVRATLSGSSSVYDPLGRPLFVPTRAGTESVHTITIMRRPDATTPYLTFGSGGTLLLAGLALLMGALTRGRKTLYARRGRPRLA